MFTPVLTEDAIKSVSLVLCYEEQYFKFGPFSDNINIPKKGSKMIIDMEAKHSFSISSASSSVFLYLLLTTSSGLQRCAGIAKIDHPAFKVMTQDKEKDDDGESYSVLFFPSNLNDACANNPVASAMVTCSHVVPVGALEWSDE